jgi:predicted DCC family thiol-disulfide oxidoreductase YuxK
LTVLALIRDRYLRIDARSLGLFRIGLALALLGDLLQRWDWIDAFYSNDGVLPNHNHLFNLRDSGQVWSIYHSFSSVDENQFAFALNLIFYLFFLFGLHTRVFHVLSLVCLVSLTGRNVLLDSYGNSVAIALCAITALLPLGSAFSIDSLRASMAARQELTPDDLNDRSSPKHIRVPASLAALVTMLMLGGILLFAGLQQTGQTWGDSTALYYALHVDRWASGAGVAVRDALPAGALGVWTKLLRITELTLLPLVLIPVARRYVRAATIALLSFYALTFAVLFTFGLYGWTLLAAVALLIPEESWEGLRKGSRSVRVWYDDDCGICLWSARLLKRLDLRQNIEFLATSDVESYPAGVTEKITERSIVAIGPSGKAQTDARALSEIARALPIVWLFSWVLRVPGIRHLADRLYRKVADNRLDISVSFGLAACGTDLVATKEEAEQEESEPESPGRVWWRRTIIALSSVLAGWILLAFLAQSEQKNTLPVATGLGKVGVLTGTASWSRMMAAWNMWAPDPPRENGTLVVDAQTRNGYVVDVMTGYEPDMNLENPKRARRGILWAEFTDRIRQQPFEVYRQEFQRYLSRGGWAVDTKVPGNQITQYSAVWLSVPTPPPGEPRAPEVSREVLFGHRGRPPMEERGRQQADETVPPLKRIPNIKLR